MADLMPAIFVGHGNPMNALARNAWTEGWAAIGKSIPRPKAILSVSAHWYVSSTALTADRAPKTTAQILRYVRVKHYDGTVVYRVVKDALIQMGSWDAKGQARSEFGGKLPLEVRNGLSNVRGSVGLARGEDPETGAADFFINVGDESPLDAAKDVPGNTTGYAVFGKVIGGMDVVDKINAVAVGGNLGVMPAEQTPMMTILVRSITIVPGTDSMMPAPGAPAAKPAAAKPTAEKKKKS